MQRPSCFFETLMLGMPKRLSTAGNLQRRHGNGAKRSNWTRGPGETTSRNGLRLHLCEADNTPLQHGKRLTLPVEYRPVAPRCTTWRVCLFALAIEVVQAGDVLHDEDARSKVVEEYVAQAVSLIAKANETAYFQSSRNMRRLDHDPKLISLRDRIEFKTLLREIANGRSDEPERD